MTTEQYLKIFESIFMVPRYGSTEWIPFTLNNAQKVSLEGIHDFNVILKSRKLGFTTLIEAFFIVNCHEFPDTKIVFLADNDDNTLSIFEKTKDLITHCNPKFDGFKNVSCEKKRIEFPNGSTITVATAGRKSAFRGKDIHGVHLSEIAFYEFPDVYEAVLEACAKGQATVFLESTANGKNLFFDLWEKAKGFPNTSNFKPFFFGWFEHPDNVIPVSEDFKPTTEELELVAKYKVSNEQLAWRRWKINSMPSPDKFPQEYPINDSEAFLSSGRPVFDVYMLDAMKNTAKTDYRTIDLIYNKSAEVALQDNKFGFVKIFEPPRSNGLYVIGADCAEGVDGGDYNAAHVADAETRIQVAEFHGMGDPDSFAFELNKLGRFYNSALMAPERNNSGYTVIRCLVNDYAYPNMFQEHTEEDTMMTTGTENYGFRTNIKTRQIIIDLAKKNIRKGLYKINSINCINEAMSFIYTKSGKPQHDSGKHDDLVFAFMITLYVLEEFGEYVLAKSDSPMSLYSQIFGKRKKEETKINRIGGY